MTSEQRLHAWLRKQLEPCDYQRVEGAATGFPDVNVCCDGVSRWIELKVYMRGRVLLRKEQNAWAMRRFSNGEDVWVVAWHDGTDEIHVWRTPEIIVIPYGKYLQITNVPRQIGTRAHIPIKTILFPDQS